MPAAATSGATTSVALSPTPPVECLSTFRPEIEPASAGRHGQRQRLGLGVRHAVQAHRHEPGGQLVVRDRSVGGTAHDELDGVVAQNPAIALISDHVDRGQ
jgi:hypothetical protein